MLSLHGLVIIAGDATGKVDIKEFTTQFGSYISFMVASDNGKGGTNRHFLSLVVPKDKVQEAKDKIKHGVVCEITHGNWTELPSMLKSSDTGEAPSRVRITVAYKDLKFLKIPMYYSEIEGVTSNQSKGEVI